MGKSLRDQSHLSRFIDSFASGMNLQLAVNLFDMSGDRVRRNRQNLADFVKAHSFCEQMQNFSENYDNSVGWIYVPDTHINYPIMQSNDNDFYLHHATDGSYLCAGSIFLDYRCNADFSSVSNILYGHNMSNRSMFADVINFTDRTYFDSHRYGCLTTENDVYSIYFFAVVVTEDTGEIYNTDSDWRTAMSEVVNRAVIYDDIEIADTDRLVMLSTCTGANSSSRTVLVGKIMEDEN